MCAARVSTVYSNRVAGRILRYDANQSTVTGILDVLSNRIVEYGCKRHAAGLLAQLLRRNEQEMMIKFPPPAECVGLPEQTQHPTALSLLTAVPKGAYLWGGVGCGKSMLMDMTIESLRDVRYSVDEVSECALSLHSHLLGNVENRINSIVQHGLQTAEEAINDRKKVTLVSIAAKSHRSSAAAASLENARVMYQMYAEYLRKFLPRTLPAPAQLLQWIEDSLRPPSSLTRPAHVGGGKEERGEGGEGGVLCGLRIRRTHMHSFMTNLHSEIHKFKLHSHTHTHTHAHTLGHSHGHTHTQQQAVATERSAMKAIARRMADETWVLALDELQVLDVADALLLSQLLSTLYAHGVVTIITSNTAPNELYANGLNRDYFVPCIEQIKRMNRIIAMQSDVDYRCVAHCNEMDREDRIDGNIQAPRKQNHDKTETDACASVPRALRFISSNSIQRDTAKDTPPQGPVETTTLETAFGRTVAVRGQVGHVAHLSFPELAGGMSSDTGKQPELYSLKHSSDFAAIARSFPEIRITGVPKLMTTSPDCTRRFFEFLDEAYNHRCRLHVVSSCGSIDDVFDGLLVSDTETASKSGPPPETTVDTVPRNALGDASVSVNPQKAVALLARRARSRMIQLCGDIAEGEVLQARATAPPIAL